MIPILPRHSTLIRISNHSCLPTPIYKRTNSWICLGMFLANLSRTFHDPTLTLGSVVSGQYIETAVSLSYALFLATKLCYAAYFPVILPSSTAIVGFIVHVVWRCSRAYHWRFQSATCAVIRIELSASWGLQRDLLYSFTHSSQCLTSSAFIFPYSQNWEHRTEFLCSPSLSIIYFLLVFAWLRYLSFEFGQPQISPNHQ